MDGKLKIAILILEDVGRCIENNKADNGAVFLSDALTKSIGKFLAEFSPSREVYLGDDIKNYINSQG